MILIDANLLLHAYNPRSPDHASGRRWLEETLSGPGLVRFAWPTLWAFLRIGTNPRVFQRPLSIREALAIVESWLVLPNTGILDAGERHWDLLKHLAADSQTAGPLVMDAVLAATAIEHGATLYSSDYDFSRFEGLDWINPLRP
jgi:toxin-antitoxin system PIN domain toxin